MNAAGCTCQPASEWTGRTFALCNLQLIAAKLRRRLRWDPEKEQFLNDAEANALLDRPMRAPWKV